MTAQTLRDAAKVLRERAEKATPGPWYWEAKSTEEWPSGDQSLLTRHRKDGGDFDPAVLYGWGYDASGIDAEQADRDYIATMHPGVGIALADWLDSEFEHEFGPTEQAINVARAILGGDV